MRRWLIAWIPWMAIATASAQTTAETKVQYLGRGEFYTGFEKSGNECYATPTAVAPLGWKVVQKRTLVEFEAEGRRFSTPFRYDSRGRVQFSLTACLKQIGAWGEWDADTYLISGAIKSISIRRNSLLVDTALPVRPKVTKMDSPDRLLIDFVGASAEAGQAFTLPDGIRVGQFQRNVFRVVIEKPGISAIDLPVFQLGKSFAIDVSPVVLLQTGSMTTSPVGTQPVKTEADQESIPQPQQVAPTPPPATRVRTPRLIPQKSGDLLIVLPITQLIASAPSSKYIDPYTIQVAIPNTAPDIASAPDLKSDLLKGVSVSDDQRGSTVVVVNTARPMGVRVSAVGTEVQLLLVLPKKLDARLTGKTVVVDAGHGGKDSGAQSPGKDVYEKNITLRIARNLADELTAAGAAAVMTRGDDVFIGLKERSDIANRLGADLFVSIHINSNSVDNTRSGTIIFYHNNDPLGRLLAQCVATEVSKVSKIPNIGTWSDTRIYKSGFAVLRNSTMPGVLCELGFINHSTDRKRMVTEDFQVEVARAIVKGIRVYFGDAEASPAKP